MNSKGEGPANRLAGSSSPYLRQHAANPVDWWPWSDAAFEEAARRDVPVFLSIGYAACHWCHVMAHESFEDPDVAAALNAAFVCVKVDREERPDVDGIYMDACLAVHGHGGWPLTALLAPDRRPFYVATYLPPTSRPGRVGVVDLAQGAARAWRDDRAGILASATSLTAALAADVSDDARPPDTAAAAEALRRMADPEHGGFGRAPKFPTPHHALFLLAEARRTGDVSLTTLATDALRAIDRGGISDVLGGGIHRYATDRAWLLPHFEKMLTDQAMFAVACTEAALMTGAADLERAALGTLAYVLRDLRLPSGLFATSEDADSPGPDGRTHEGAFYLWTEAALLDVLGPADALLARRAFGTTPEGTFADEATGRRDGTNVLHRADVDALAAPRFPAVCQRLFDARARRPRPGLDDKALADGNGLTLAALALAARAFGRPDLTVAMRETAAALLATFRRPEGGLWHRAPTDSEPGVPGLLDDSAFTVWGLVETYQTTFDAADLDAALALYADAERRFADAAGSLFVSEADAADLIARRPSRHDGAVPAGASVHLWNAIRLGALVEDAALAETGRSRLNSAEHPTGQTMRLRAALDADAPVTIVVGRRDAPDTRDMLVALRAVPSALVGLRDGGASRVGNAGQTMLDGRATAYVCRHGACLEPTADPARAATLARG